MAKPKSDPKAKSDEFMSLARQRHKQGVEAERENDLEALDDARFVAGEQWPEVIKKQRFEQGRPCLVINRMPGFVRQVTNELRLKPTAIKVHPAEQGDVETAQVIEGLIRSIEQLSDAKRVYARAAEDAARCSKGWMRVKTAYNNDEAFDLDLAVEHINNPFAVVYDPNSLHPTRRDAKWCFVTEEMGRDEFKAKWPKVSEQPFYDDEAVKARPYGDWVTKDTIRIAEYWVVSEEDKTLLLLDNGATILEDDYGDLIKAFEEAVRAQQALGMQSQVNGAPVQPEPVPRPPGVALDANGAPQVRKVKRKKVECYLVNGAEVLEGPTLWPGDRIPIVPVYGEEVRIGDRVVRSSVIRWAKDAQRMINYWRSASVEMLALAPKAPYVVTPKQVSGFEGEWRNSMQGNPVYLRYNPDPAAGGPPQKQQPPPVQSAMLQEAALAQDDLKATTGIYDASLGNQSNETSGKAILARQKEGDVSTYAFIDNVLQAVEEIGRILVNMIPKIYTEKRQIRILGKKLEPKIMSVNDGGQFDLTRGKYDVSVDTGPSYQSARAEAAQSLTEILQAAPMLAPVLLPRLADVIDIPDADELSAEIKQFMQPQAPQVSPTDQAKAQLDMAKAKGQEIDNLIKVHGFEVTGGGMASPDASSEQDAKPAA